MTETELRELFEDLKARYFSRRLRGYRVALVERVPRKHVTTSGYCDNRRRILYVVAGRDDETIRRTLLHEMCHVGSSAHGKVFCAKLRRLAEQGEAWAEDEARGLEEQPWRQPAQLVRVRLEDIAEDMPETSWKDVLRYVARDMSRTQKEIRRIAPWGARVWKRLSDKSKEVRRLQAELRARISERANE